MMSEAGEFVYQTEDLVKVEGKEGVWTVKGESGVMGQPPSRYQVQLGLDASKIDWVTPDRMTLVERPKPKDDGLGPRLIPERGIMD
jgi:hypothetical protein